jgi:hypothetical protein
MITLTIKQVIAAIILLIACAGLVSGTTITAQGGPIPAPGDIREFPIIVDSLPNGLSGFTMTITLSDPLKAEINEIITPPWADIGDINGTLVSGPNQHVSVMADSVGLSIATFEENFSPDGNLILVTLEIEGVTQGSTGLQITDVDIQDEGGNPIATSVQNGVIVIGNVTPTATSTETPTTTPTATPTATPTEPPSETTGSIDVQSTPEGGDVYLDGNLVGLTPVVVADLSPGQYTVVIQKDGYEPFENTSVIVSEGNTTSVVAVLEPTPSSGTTGSLDITSIPSGADVYLDDAFEGSTPLLIVNLDPGAYMLRIEKQGYNSWYQGITVIGGETIFITAPLTPTPTINPTPTSTPTPSSVATGGLFVVSEPPATVFVDGIERGKSNEVIDKVPTGVRNVTLFKAGFIPKSVMVNIGVAKVTVTAKIVLEPGAGPTLPTNLPTAQPTTASTTVPTTIPTTVPNSPNPYQSIPSTGGVFIYSVPFGSSVYIDDVYKGVTPNLFISIPPGVHSLKVTLPGYRDVYRSVTVNSGEISIVSILMTLDLGGLGSGIHL